MDTTEKPDHKIAPDFSHRLLDWYRVHARAMPWRVTPEDYLAGERANPYHVWISEVMLQQTQVITVKDYFLKFIDLWPTVHDLAASDLEDVLKAWAGLGYYSRARNLKKCAEQVSEHHDGKFPQTAEALKKLPGIGDYTAAAIASIAFDEPVAVVDGNIERVMSRHQRIEAYFPDAKPQLKEMLSDILDPKAPGEFAQAMMDLGATICTPKNPACALCPVNADCTGFKNGDAENYPRKRPKPEKPVRKGAAFVLQNAEGEIFLCKRESSGLLAGMTQVPTTNWNARQNGAVTTDAAPVPADWKKAGTAKHTFTHFHLELTVWRAHASRVDDLAGWWCKREDIFEEALPNLMKKVISVALED